MVAKHYVIYVPGLADRTVRKLGQEWLIHQWRISFRVATAYHPVHWADPKSTLSDRRDKLLKRIDDCRSRGYTVSLVASSAGGSLALHAFALRPDAVHRVVLIGPKLNRTDNVAPAIFAANPAFKTCLQQLPQALKKLADADLRRVLIVKPQSDRVVPLEDMSLAGATELQLPVRGHLWTIAAALSIYSPRLMRFIKRRD